MPTEEICVEFNELRNDLVFLYELKTAMASCEFELQSLRHQYEATNPGKVIDRSAYCIIQVCKYAIYCPAPFY